MKLAFLSASLAAALSLAAVSAANAWTRSGSVTTARGTYYGSASGPYGGAVSRSGSITRTGPDSYSYSRTTTGPNGNSVTRGGTVSVNRY